MTNEELVARIQQGEAGLLDALLEQNKGMIYRTAWRYLYQAERNRGLDGEDLLQAARLGMIEAVPGWDSERGAFITLAVFFMRRAIRRALGIHTGKERIENVAPPASLNAPVGEEADGDALQDFIPDDYAVDPQQAAEDRLFEDFTARTVRAAVDALQEPQREVIRDYYLDGLPVAAIAQRNGLEPERVHVIRNAGLRSLRHYNRALSLLWAEYEAAAYTKQSYEAWRCTGTSPTERAAIRREELTRGLGRMMRRD